MMFTSTNGPANDRPMIVCHKVKLCLVFNKYNWLSVCTCFLSNKIIVNPPVLPQLRVWSVDNLNFFEVQKLYMYKLYIFVCKQVYA